MIAVLKSDATEQQVDNLVNWFTKQDIKVTKTVGEYCTVLGLIGDTSGIDVELLMGLDIIEKVTRISDPFKKANRKFHPEDSVVEIGGVKIGGGNFAIIAGPDSVESEEQIISAALSAKASGANILRGGCFMPRTSPYDFQGLGKEGIDLLLKAKEATGLPVISEIVTTEQLPLLDGVDCLQISARNMQNYELLKLVGKENKPVLLKRGPSATIKEFLMSAEYIMAEGNENVILCEGGIRTFETMTRNTLDVSAIAMIKELSHLPIIVDPSHATGKATLIKSAAMASTAAGADGLEIVIHPNPKEALSGGQQSLDYKQWKDVASSVERVRSIL